MTDDLVKELRASYDPNDAVPMQVCLDAADRIEKLEAALREINRLYEGEEIAEGLYVRHSVLETHDKIYEIVCKALEGKDD